MTPDFVILSPVAGTPRVEAVAYTDSITAAACVVRSLRATGRAAWFRRANPIEVLYREAGAFDVPKEA